MNKTGKIKFIQPKGKGQPFIDKDTGQEIILDRYLIGFSDGGEYTFSAKGEWKHDIGTEIEYEVSNEQYKTAKKARAVEQNTFEFSNTKSSNFTYPKPSTNDSIILQVCYKENMQAFAKENRSVVMEQTEEDFISLRQILNNITDG
tara:strand:- start:133 stop:570 length:438 start_codon:yes stop_codon:yes gene_type:complete